MHLATGLQPILFYDTNLTTIHNTTSLLTDIDWKRVINVHLFCTESSSFIQTN